MIPMAASVLRWAVLLYSTLLDCRGRLHEIPRKNFTESTLKSALPGSVGVAGGFELVRFDICLTRTRPKGPEPSVWGQGSLPPRDARSITRSTVSQALDLESKKRNSIHPSCPSTTIIRGRPPVRPRLDFYFSRFFKQKVGMSPRRFREAGSAAALLVRNDR